MRRALLLLAAIGLAACDSEGVPPPGQEALRASAPQVAADSVELRPEGIVVGAESFYFAAGRREVETALAEVLGEPAETTLSDDCGAGPLAMTRYPGGLAVHFQKDFLVGWNVAAQPDEASPAGQISVVGDVQIGTPRAQAEAANGFAMIAGSTLGNEFALGNRMGGFLEAGVVNMLYSGTQCFAR
jgi:hypothetical protein